MGANIDDKRQMYAARQQQAMKGREMGRPSTERQEMRRRAMERRALENQEMGSPSMERQGMRRRAMEQLAQAFPTQEQGVAPEFASQEPTDRRPAIGTNIGMGRWSDMPSGIYFGPGRADRLQGELETGREQLLQKIFNKGQK